MRVSVCAAVFAMLTSAFWPGIADAQTSAPPPGPAELGRVGFYSLAAVAPLRAAAAGRLVARTTDLAAAWLHAALVPVNAHGATDPEIAAACQGAGINAVFVFFYQEKSTVEGSRLHELAESHLDLFDCFGDIAYDGAGTAEGFFSHTDASDGSITEARIATDRAFAALQDQARIDPSALSNLVQYGFALGDGERTTGLQLRPGALGALANPLNFGTAARAGVRKDDLVSSLNGQSLAGLGDADLHALIEDAEKHGGTYVVEVTSTDGKSSKFAFASEDLAGYVHDLETNR